MNHFETIDHFIHEYAPSVVPTQEENREHFKRILACEDDTELDAFIFANIRLVACVVSKIFKRHRLSIYLIDDMFADGLCTMIRALRTLIRSAKRDPEKFWSILGREEDSGEFYVLMYLYISIYREVQTCYEHDAIQPISERNITRFTPDGCDKPIRKIQIGPFWLEQIEYDHFKLIFLLEDIMEHCLTDFEHNVIIMRMTMRDYEIARVLECSRQLVSRTRKKVYKRYQASLEASLEASLGDFND